MSRLIVEFVAICVAAVFALVAAPMISRDANVAFFVALIGGMAVWECVRLVMLRYSNRAGS